MQNTTLVEVKNVYKAFKTVNAVDGLSFKVKQGQFLALLGPNGAGKTTMVEMIEGIQHPDSGEIVIDGKKWLHHADEIHPVIGLSLQETKFIDKLNVRETLALFASFYGLGSDRVEEVIVMTGLEEKRKAYVENLSGGQRQRLALGIALLNKPKILLLDEPTTGLDPTARREVWAILRKLKKESGTALILTTHYMEEAEQLCDYIIILDHGKILREGSLDKLFSDSAGKKIVEFTVRESVCEEHIFNDYPGVPVQWDLALQKGILEMRNLDNDLPGFLDFLKKKQLTLLNMEMHKVSLDTLFIQLTGRHLNES
jgi:ABC-2 type transport system ATP-binding protein